MKKIIVIAVVLALAAVFVNDLGAFVNTRRELVEATREAADVAAGTRGDRNTAGRAAAAAAAARGVEVYLYDQDGTRVQVWARAEIEGTLVYGRVLALIAGEPLDTPPVLEHYETRPVR